VSGTNKFFILGDSWLSVLPLTRSAGSCNLVTLATNYLSPNIRILFGLELLKKVQKMGCKKQGAKSRVQKAGCKKQGAKNRVIAIQKDDPCFQNKNSGCKMTGRVC
jgi:hypothetical protein